MESQDCRAFIVNIGDLMERWTNCLYRSTMHRVKQTGKERYSACIEYGFFYLVNHGVENDLVKAFDESKRFFSLPPGEKMKLARKEFRGYTPQDPTLGLHGDSKESYYIGPMADSASVKLNQWPSEELLENWRPSIEAIYWKLFEAGKKLYSLIALSLNMDEDFFDKIGAVDKPSAFLRLLRYPGEMGPHQEICSAHSDTGALTLLMTDGVPGLQICRDKLKEPRVWEDVPYMEGAFIVNIGDLMERWTNCLYRSTMHRVKRTGKERYSMAFFLDPHPDCVVECLKSCCSESCPPRFTPIRSGDYMDEILSNTPV
ncbi:2-oxoglutarate-Fe(II) type oxidoreductase hxnY [Glycine max]|nr:2-oxoglutarate-Fe(II) type oxidoreductase hxnY [Glycine max]